MAIKILYIAPSSYPPNNPEAYVNAKQIKLLADAGCEIDLLCGRICEIGYPQDDDKTLFRNVRSITHVPLDRSRSLSTLWDHFRSFWCTGYLYKGINWVYPALKQCKKLIQQNHYDYVLTKDYPSEVLGVYIAKHYDIKWIATWNDPYMWIKYPAPYGKGVNAPISFLRKRLIREIGKYSYKNLFPSDRLRDYMLRYMSGMKKESCVIIPHALLNEFSLPCCQNRDDKILKIIYAGSLGKERDPRSFMYGIAKFRERHPDFRFQVDIFAIFNDAFASYFETLLNKLNLKDIVHQCQPVKYKESLYIIAQYDVCLIIEAPCDEGIFLPSKVIDYFQSKRAIWALSPSVGVLSDMYQTKLIDYFADITDSNAICESLEKIARDFANKKISDHKEYPAIYTPQHILQSFYNNVFL